MNTETINQADMEKVSGGFLTSKDMEWLVNCMKLAKSMGATLEQFLESGGNEPESVEFCKFMWDRI